eukprot:TRINITY_DN85895_c0_g1_i1.p1 TRINITY_DN85895_c0_g1~~TRINITY_DN85895_c0_g1_i1.p1  ORF type:complete len:167 (-),score=22.30 TRINITY_DN85895_c0_g1_i1:150-650(-)
MEGFNHPSLKITIKSGPKRIPAHKNIPDIIPPDRFEHLARQKLESFDMIGELAKFREIEGKTHHGKRLDISEGHYPPLPDATRSIMPIGGTPQFADVIPPRGRRSNSAGRLAKQSEKCHLTYLGLTDSPSMREPVRRKWPKADGTPSMRLVEPSTMPCPLHMRYTF